MFDVWQLRYPDATATLALPTTLNPVQPQQIERVEVLTAPHETVELRLAVRANVHDLAVQHCVAGIQARAERLASVGKDLYVFPLRETRRTAPRSRYASARKPSYFSSKSQSGWSKGWRRSASGIGTILGIGNDYQFSRAGQSRAARSQAWPACSLRRPAACSRVCALMIVRTRSRCPVAHLCPAPA